MIIYHEKRVGLLVKNFFISKELTYQVQSHKKAYPQDILSHRIVLKAEMIESLFEIEVKP